MIAWLQFIMFFLFTPLSIAMLVVGFIWGALAGLLNTDTDLPMRLGLLGFLLTAGSVIFWWIFPLGPLFTRLPFT